ncbi:[weak similarity to] Anticodon nuclease PrrC, partial [methanotrophic bacterial endosymbiont of Bathymodiolus sp.]
LTEIAQQLESATKTKAVAEKDIDVNVQLIYAFNGTGKTRLSREFKDLITQNNPGLVQQTVQIVARFAITI